MTKAKKPTGPEVGPQATGKGETPGQGQDNAKHGQDLDFGKTMAVNALQLLQHLLGNKVGPLLDRMQNPVCTSTGTNAGMEGRTFFVEKGYTPFEQQHVHRTIRCDEEDSFIEMVKRMADYKLAAIFFDDTGVECIADFNRWPYDSSLVEHDFTLSDEMRGWNTIINNERGISQKGFREFLEIRLDEYNEDDTHLFQAISNITLHRDVKLTAAVDERDNISLAYETKEGRSSSKVPRDFTITVPYWAGDDISEPEGVVSIPCRLKTNRVDKGDTEVRFVVESPWLERIHREQVQRLVDYIADCLEGYAFYKGDFQWAHVSFAPVPMPGDWD